MKRISSMSLFLTKVKCGVAIRHNALLLLAVMLLSIACSKSDDYVYIDDTKSNDGKVNVTVTDANGTTSNVTAGSQMGIYVTDADGNVTFLKVSVGQDGSVVLPATVRDQKIVAYLPYQEEWGDDAMSETELFTVKENQSTQSGYDASDLMIGSNAITRATSASGLNFSRMLAQVIINIVDATGSNDFYDCGVSLHDVDNTVAVVLSEQSVSTVKDMKGNVSMLPVVVSDYRLSVKAIVAPQEIYGGERFIVFNNGGYSRRYAIPQTADLQGGKTYTINMRLTTTGLEFVGSSVTDWDEVGDVSLEIK